MYEILYKEAKKKNADLVSCYVCNFDDEIGKKHNCTFGGGFTRIVKKEVLMNNHIRFPEKIMYEDNYFWPLVERYVNKHIIVPSNLYYSREQQSSVRHTVSSKTIRDRLSAEEMLLKEMLKRNLETRPFSKEFEKIFLEIYCINTFYMFALVSKVNLELIDMYIDSCNEQILKYFPNYQQNEFIRKEIRVRDRILLWTLKNTPRLAWCMVFLCSTVLKTFRNVKRKVQSFYFGLKKRKNI